MSGINGLVAGGAAAAAGNGTTKSGGVTLQDLQKRYPSLKLTAQAFHSESAVRSYAMNQSGKYNVAIHPKALERMGEDGEFGEKIHEILGHVTETDDRLERAVNAFGSTLVACGTIIDENGNTAMWSVSRSEGSGPNLYESSRKSMEDLAKRMEERRNEQKELDKKAEEKRLKQLRESADAAEVAGQPVVTETVEVKSSVSVDLEA